jgi:hypothetical protein
MHRYLPTPEISIWSGAPDPRGMSILLEPLHPSFAHNFMMIGFCTVLLLNYSVEIQTSLPKSLILSLLFAHSHRNTLRGDQSADVHRSIRLVATSL